MSLNLPTLTFTSLNFKNTTLTTSFLNFVLFAKIKLLSSFLTTFKSFLSKIPIFLLSKLLTRLFASSKTSNAKPTPLLSSSALSIALTITNTFPSRVSKNPATLNTPPMSFGACNFIVPTNYLTGLFPKIATLSTTLKKPIRAKFNSAVLKIGRVSTMTFSSNIFLPMTALFPALNLTSLTKNLILILTIVLSTTTTTKIDKKASPLVLIYDKITLPKNNRLCA